MIGNKHFALWAALLGAQLFGCSAGEGEFAGEDDIAESSEAALGNCSSGRLGSPIISHVCNHYLYGPWYGARAASNSSPPYFGVKTTDTSTSGPLPAATNDGWPHFYYTVTLPSAGGGSYSGKMKFKPGSVNGAGDYVIFYNPGVTVTVKNGATTLSPDPAISPAPGVMTCAGFTGYKVYNLSSSSTSYEITLAASQANVNVTFERVADYVRRCYQDLDGDTWGNSSVFVSTACDPPASHPATQGSDCNESNASINPAAPETCGDGIDSNCNGNDCT